MNTKQLHKIVDKCVEASIKDGKISDASIKRCIKMLKQLPRAEAIVSLQLYKKGLQRALDQSTLTIESVVRLPAAMTKKISAVVNCQLKITQTVALRTKTILNPSLLGGLRLKIGDVVIDDSVSNRIEQLKERISA